MTAEQWNRLHPVGTLVRFYPAPNDRRNFIQAKTRGSAYHLSTGTAVVPLQGAGTKAVDKLEIAPIPQPVM